MKQAACRLSGVVGLSIVGFALAAQAQTAGDATATSRRSDSSAQLEEVVVTAEKRSERVQDTPISITALTGADLQAQGISNAEDAAREIPGVALTSAGPGQTEYTIRGLSSSGPAVSTVGFYLDDVPVAAPCPAHRTVMFP